jgi:hypothetical protein
MRRSWIARRCTDRFCCGLYPVVYALQPTVALSPALGRTVPLAYLVLLSIDVPTPYLKTSWDSCMPPETEKSLKAVAVVPSSGGLLTAP